MILIFATTFLLYYFECDNIFNCSVLMTNEMHNSYNQILFYSFLSAVHVSNESSRSSSAARHNVLYYTFGTIGTIVLLAA